MMHEHSERQFVPYSSHIFQAPETFITRNTPRMAHYPEYPHGEYIPPSDDEILEMVVRTITENKILSQSTDNSARVRAPVIEASSTSAEDVPERVYSPVVPCSSTVDSGGHDEGGSKEDGENAPSFRNDEADYRTKSRPEKHSSEMGKEGPVAEDMEEDLYCMTDLGVPNASQHGEPRVATPSPVMMVLPAEFALQIACLQKGRSDKQYEDVTDESAQVDVKPHKRGESLLEPSCNCQDTFFETDDGNFVCQPCPACLRQKELQKLKGDTAYGISEMQDEQEELTVDESPSVSTHANGFYQSDNETEDEEDDWIVIGPMGISSLKYIPPDVRSKSSSASSQLEVFDNMQSFKEAKAKLLGIAADHIHGVEVHQSNTGSSGTAAPIAPARSSPPFRAAPQTSPQHSAEKSTYSMPLSPPSTVTGMEHSSDSSNDSDLRERKVKRRKLSKSKNMVSKSKAESDQRHNKPGDCQKRALIFPEIEREPCTPQSNSSETENSSDVSMSPPHRRNRLTFPNHPWNERSNSPPYMRSISNSESGVHDSGDTASSPLRRSMSLEPELERQKIKKTILETLKNDTEKKQAKNGDEKAYGLRECYPESALKLDKSRMASLQYSESVVKSASYVRPSSAVTKANVYKREEGLPASREGPSASRGPFGTGIKEKLKQRAGIVYQPSQNGGKLTSVEMDEQTMSMPGRPPGKRRISRIGAPGQRRNSQEPAPGPKRNSLESAAGQRLSPHEFAPIRKRHKSHENPLLKKTIAEARGETKRKATKVAHNEQSGSKDGSKDKWERYKWRHNKNSRDSPVILDWDDRDTKFP